MNDICDLFPIDEGAGIEIQSSRDKSEKRWPMWSAVRRRVRSGSEGQGLLEFALALPVLIIIFLGLIELALLLRAHLVVANANREAARLASRGTFTNEQVINWSMYSFAEQLPIQLNDTAEAESNARVVITRFHVPASPTGTVTYNDPPPYITGTLPATKTDGVLSVLDPDAYADELRAESNDFNDKLRDSGLDAVPTAQDIVYVETFYIHKELLRAPIISWVFPDEMVVYAWTVMRIGSKTLY
jgi:Flp pilus assembly protein TadG